MENREKYSFSRLNNFRTCPYGYYLSYVKHTCTCGQSDCFDETENGLYKCKHCGEEYDSKSYSKLKPIKSNNAFASFGTLIHELCEKCTTGEYALNDLADIYEWQFDEAVPEKFPPNKYVDLHDSYYKQGLDFLNSWDGFKDCNIIAAEEEFTIQVDDFDLGGFIDLQYFDENGKLILLDYKSKKTMNKNEIVHYGHQPYLYSDYVHQKMGKWPDILRFYLFRSDQFVDIHWTEQGYNEARQWAIDTVKEIREAWDYDMVPNDFFCQNICSVRTHCKNGKYHWRANK